MSDPRHDAGTRRSLRTISRIAVCSIPPLLLALAVSAARSPGWQDRRLRHLPEAELARLAATRPDDARAQRGWAERLLQRGDLAAAEQAFRRAAEADPTDRRAWVGWGNAMLALGRPKPALEVLRQAVEQWPDDAPARFGAAAAYSALNDAASAATHLREGLRLDGDNADGWLTLASVLEQLGQAEEGEAAYLAAVRRRAQDLRARAGRARCLLTLRRWREAREEARAALQEDPSHLEARLLMAETYIAQGDAAARGIGMKELARAGAFHPEAAAPPRRVGELWMESEDYADAAQSFARAADLDPGDESHLLKAAEAYERLKAPERVRLYRQRAAEIAALKSEAARLEAAAAAAPRDAAPLLARARVCRRLRWYREALGAYRGVLHVQPRNAEAVREVEALERLIRTREEEGQVITGPS